MSRLSTGSAAYSTAAHRQQGQQSAGQPAQQSTGQKTGQREGRAYSARRHRGTGTQRAWRRDRTLVLEANRILMHEEKTAAQNFIY